MMILYSINKNGIKSFLDYTKNSKCTTKSKILKKTIAIIAIIIPSYEIKNSRQNVLEWKGKVTLYL